MNWRNSEDIHGAIVFDDCDSAVIGYGSQHGFESVLIYDYNLLIINCIEQGMTEEEAMEYVDYNIVGLWAGDRTPIIMFRFLEES